MCMHFFQLCPFVNIELQENTSDRWTGDETKCPDLNEYLNIAVSFIDFTDNKHSKGTFLETKSSENFGWICGSPQDHQDLPQHTHKTISLWTILGNCHVQSGKCFIHNWSYKDRRAAYCCSNVYDIQISFKCKILFPVFLLKVDWYHSDNYQYNSKRLS